MRRPLYIPEEVKTGISKHISEAIPRAIEGYWSANEDEDTLTGHLGAVLRIGSQRVRVAQSEVSADWTWSIDYYKFRGRGKGATENILGADGLFELKLQLGYRTEIKSLLFQAKKNWSTDSSLVDQCVKMSTWREAAFVLNFTPGSFQAYSLDDVLRSQGTRQPDTHYKPLTDFLAGDFVECVVGDTDLSYEPKASRLIWRAVSGEVVATVFTVKHRIRVNVKALPASTHDRVDRHIPNSEIHKYRMEARPEEILSLNSGHSLRELKAARNNLFLAYHPDKYGEVDELLKQILNRRMQEINDAYEFVHLKGKQKK